MTEYDATDNDRDPYVYKPARALSMTQFRRTLALQIEHVVTGRSGSAESASGLW